MSRTTQAVQLASVSGSLGESHASYTVIRAAGVGPHGLRVSEASWSASAEDGRPPRLTLMQEHLQRESTRVAEKDARVLLLEARNSINVLVTPQGIKEMEQVMLTYYPVAPSVDSLVDSFEKLFIGSLSADASQRPRQPEPEAGEGAAQFKALVRLDGVSLKMLHAAVPALTSSHDAAAAAADPGQAGLARERSSSDGRDSVSGEAASPGSPVSPGSPASPTAARHRHPHHHHHRKHRRRNQAKPVPCLMNLRLQNLDLAFVDSGAALDVSISAAGLTSTLGVLSAYELQAGPTPAVGDSGPPSGGAGGGPSTQGSLPAGAALPRRVCDVHKLVVRSINAQGHFESARASAAVSGNLAPSPLAPKATGGTDSVQLNLQGLRLECGVDAVRALYNLSLMWARALQSVHEVQTGVSFRLQHQWAVLSGEVLKLAMSLSKPVREAPAKMRALYELCGPEEWGNYTVVGGHVQLPRWTVLTRFRQIACFIQDLDKHMEAIGNCQVDRLANVQPVPLDLLAGICGAVERLLQGTPLYAFTHDLLFIGSDERKAKSFAVQRRQEDLDVRVSFADVVVRILVERANARDVAPRHPGPFSPQSPHGQDHESTEQSPPLLHSKFPPYLHAQHNYWDQRSQSPLATPPPPPSRAPRCGPQLACTARTAYAWPQRSAGRR
jgi:hypothetical protein